MSENKKFGPEDYVEYLHNSRKHSQEFFNRQVEVFFKDVEEVKRRHEAGDMRDYHIRSLASSLEDIMKAMKNVEANDQGILVAEQLLKIVNSQEE